MIKPIKKTDVRDTKPLLLIVVVSILALAPALIYGVPANRDLQSHFRMALSFKESFSHGDFYPGWVAEANNGYGDVSVRFYPPGLAFLLALTQSLTGNWYVTTLMIFTFLTLVGGLGTYEWARNFYAPRVAMWAGVFYIFMPYHINELYQSSLLGEYAAASVLPFAFAFTEKLCRDGGKRSIGGLAASYALLILANLPLAIIGSYALVLYLLLTTERREIWATLSRFAGAIALGLLASACFWFTVLAELPWLRPDNENTFNRINFIFSSFRRQAGDTGIWYGNLLAFATLAMLLPAVILLRSRDQTEVRRVLKTVGLLAAFSFLMTTVISLPVWEILPKLKDVQLPWRWLAVTSMASAVLTAGSIPWWKEIATSRRRPIALLAVGCVSLSLAFTISHPIREAHYLPSHKFDAVVAHLPGLPTIGAWYPKWVSDKFLVMPQLVVAAQRSVTIGAWQSEHRIFQVSEGPATDARVHTFYYPLWRASAAGRTLATRPDEDGTLIVSLPPESVSVDLSFREPRRSLISGILSIVGWILILILIVRGAKPKATEGERADI